MKRRLRHMWNGKVTIVRDKRRAVYCVRQIRRVLKRDAELNKYLDDMEIVLHYESVLFYQHAYMIETFYRSMVLNQGIPQTMIKDINQ